MKRAPLRCHAGVALGAVVWLAAIAPTAAAAAEPRAPLSYDPYMRHTVQSYPVPGWSPHAREAMRAGGDVVYVVSGEGTTVFSAADFVAARTERTGTTPNWHAPSPARTSTGSPAAAPTRPIVRGTAPPPPTDDAFELKVEAPIEPAAGPAGTQIARRAGEGGLGGILSEVRLGAMAHDVGILGRSEEDDAIDVNAEILFVSPDFLEPIWSPRPHIGITANTNGDTSQIYGGLAWDWNFWGPFFVEGTLALTVHDGELDPVRSDKKALGCRVLFRESVSLGARFLERHSLSLMLAHISNASLCDNNEGLDTFGIRYGYRF